MGYFPQTNKTRNPQPILMVLLFMPFTVKSSHLYLYSAFNNTDCVKAALQYQCIK